MNLYPHHYLLRTIRAYSLIYEDNGFGPVCYELDTTVDAIIREIENDCKNSEEYIKRIEDFYEYFDTKSCKRVYEAIRALDEVK